MGSRSTGQPRPTRCARPRPARGALPWLERGRWRSRRNRRPIMVSEGISNVGAPVRPARGRIRSRTLRSGGRGHSNLMTEWHARYGGPGVMIYWHVERKERLHLQPAEDLLGQRSRGDARSPARHMTTISPRNRRPCGRSPAWRHDQHDLFDRRRIGGVVHALVARRLTAAMTGRRGR